MGIEPTREATNPLQTVLKTARHTSTYLPPGRGETSTSVMLTALKKLYQKSAAVSIPQRSFYTVSDKPFYRILRSEIVRRHGLSARLCNYGSHPLSWYRLRVSWLLRIPLPCLPGQDDALCPLQVRRQVRPGSS